MSVRAEWSTISARIQGVTDASAIYLASLGPRANDPYRGADEEILPECREIYSVIKGFLDRRRPELVPAAVCAIERFLNENQKFFEPGQSAGWQGMKRVVPALVVLRSQIDFHLADFSATARRITERAFLHLQRSIVADPEIRRRWVQAFSDGEIACEKLGAAHLLLHGIWAFKVAAEGERTDLVMGEPIRDASQIEMAADALVLTEWKKVSDPAAEERTAQAGRSQAALYAKGSLGGIELASYGYIVLVSERALPGLTDIEDAGRTYRHINIAVAPCTPSRA